MVQVRFFASLREAVGASTLQLDVTSTESLLEELATKLTTEAYAAVTARSVRMAVNQEIIEGTTLLRDGDEVAFLPPVTGG